MVAVTAICGLLALVAGRGIGTVLVVLAVLAGQLFVGWSNDYLDRDLDLGSGRTDKPVARGHLQPRMVLIAAIAALVATVPLSLASGVPATVVHLAAIGSATAYNLGLKATPLSALPYAVSFSLLPAFITLGLVHPHWPLAWIMGAAGLIGVGAHFAQARPDVEHDRAQRIRGLPQLVGERMSGIFAALFLAAGAAVVAAATRNPIPLVAFVPAVGVAIAKPRPAFWLAIATAAITVLAFVAIGAPYDQS